VLAVIEAIAKRRQEQENSAAKAPEQKKKKKFSLFRKPASVPSIDPAAGRLAVLDVLLDAGADATAVDMLGRGFLDYVDELKPISHREEVRAAFLAKRQSSIRTMPASKKRERRSVTREGPPDVVQGDSERERTLYDLCGEGDVDAVERLLDNQEDSISVNCTPYTARRSPLHNSSFKGQANVASLLLTWGADVNQRDHLGRTPLMACVCSRAF